jgi:glycosyltransferase involved in cell wall biosynthesis
MAFSGSAAAQKNHMSEITVSVFDPNIIETSPAGSCLLKMLRAAGPLYKLELFTVNTDLKASDRLIIHKLPVPEKPVVLQNLLFTLLSGLRYWFAPSAKRSLKIATQGAFPFCEISYTHNPHKLFLTRYRSLIGGTLLTRTARLLNYHWIAFVESIAFRHARVIVVPSQGLADELIETYGKSIAEKIRVIVNPVDWKAFAIPQPVVPRRPFTFAFCALGNFEWKGLGLIIQALAGGINAQLLVIGGNPAEIRHFGALAESSGVASRVEFLGLQRDIRSGLWASHAFVFPSVHESFGLVCVQAAAAGLPLITTDLYALRQLVQPGISGWRVERNVASLGTAMREALAHPQRTADMGRNAQSLAKDYDEPVFQKHWLELLATMKV